jgi:hypothetical protein
MSTERQDQATPAGSHGLLAEVRDAVTVRAALLVVAVLGIGLGFIASYVAAFHHPVPRGVAVGVVVPGSPSASRRLAGQLDRLPGSPLSARVIATPGIARSQILDRRLAGALIASGSTKPDRLLVASADGAALSQAIQVVVSRAELARHRRLVVADIVPASPGDARGLTAFYLVVGWMVGGYLVAAILGISAGARPANRQRLIIRTATLGLYAILAGIGGTLLVYGLVEGLPGGHLLALWGLGALLVFATAVFTMALEIVAGVVGIGLAIIIFVVLGNPSAGGAYPGPLLPGFWRAIGPWIVPGAGVSAVRGIVYFGGNQILSPLLVLAGYAAVGLLVSAAIAGRRSGHPEAS